MNDTANQLAAVRDAARKSEREDLERAMRDCHGNISKIAKRLGLSRYQVYRRLDKHGLRGGT